MKIKIKNIFNKKSTYDDKDKINENIVKYDNEIKEENINNKSKRRKGAYVTKKKKKVNLKGYFDNLFKNKNNLSKGYYILLFGMLVLGGASVAITFKAYNLFAKEDYELYATTDTSDENSAISTISEVENVENIDKEKMETKEGTSNINVDISSNTSKAQVKTKTTTTKKSTAAVKPLNFSKPISGDIQKPYSIDKVIYSKTLELWKTHDGIDIAAEIGASVKAIEKGTIEKIYDDSFYGMTVVIDHGQGYKSSYSNLDKNVSVKTKQSVSKSQVLGKVSNTSIGESKDAPHLHFTLFKDNNNVDPTYIFK